jgi:hypothetical protein
MTTPTRRSSDDATLATVCAAVLGAVFSVVGLVAYDARTAASVAIGAAIAIANLLTMRAIIRALIREPEPEPERDAEREKNAGEHDDADHRGAGRRGGVAWGVFALLKIFLLFGGVWILLTKRLVDPIPLVVGYGVLPLGIAASALVRSLSPRR